MLATLIADTKLVLLTDARVEATETSWVGFKGVLVPEIETEITTEYAGEVAALADEIALTKALLDVEVSAVAILEIVEVDNGVVEPLNETAKTTEVAES